MTSCGCIWAGEPAFYSETIADGVVRSVVDRKCGECRRCIRIGERYHSFIGDDDGVIHHYATCSDCVSIRDEFFCNGWIWGHIIEHVSEHVDEVGGEIHSDCLLRLTPTAREMVLDMIDELWFEYDEE